MNGLKPKKLSARCKIWGEKDFGSKGEGIGVRKGEEALRDAVSKAILDMRADGTYKQIDDKYFDFDIYGG